MSIRRILSNSSLSILWTDFLAKFCTVRFKKLVLIMRRCLSKFLAGCRELLMKPTHI